MNTTCFGGTNKILFWRYAPALVAILLFLTPLIAMKFTHEVQWTAFDFGIFGAMLAFVCGLYELSFRVKRDPSYLFGVAVFFGATFLLVWVNLAVGIIGNGSDPKNLFFFGASALAVLGSLSVRVRPLGMKRLAMTMAGVQITLGAFFFQEPLIPVVTLLFATFWGVSAYCFGRSKKT